MRFILYFLMLGVLLNSNITKALTPNKEDLSSLFGVFACYSNDKNSTWCNHISNGYIILADANSNESNIFLDDSIINTVDDFSNIDLLKKEIETLNKELDSLAQKLANLEAENQQLKLSLEKVNKEEQNKTRNDSLTNELQKEARQERANNTDQHVPDQYMKAQNLLIIGDIDLAKKQFEDFLVKNSSTVDNNKSTSVKQDIDNTYIAYANYWLGKINIIENNYNKSVQYFAECYKITHSQVLSLKSLVGLIASLTNLAKPNEACTAIRQFDQDYQKALKEKSFNFSHSYLKLIENYKSINRCQ